MDNRTRGTKNVVELDSIPNETMVENLKGIISDRLSKTDMRAYRHIGFTKPTLESRVKKNRLKEKNRRKQFAKTKNRTR